MQSADSFSSTFCRSLSDVLPKLAFVCCLLVLPGMIARIPSLLYQSGMLTLAGILLPWQPLRAKVNVSRFQHQVQAAAAEAETEEAAETPKEEEQANDNTIIESGAELGSVQTPASVWLPYSTAPTRVRLQSA